MIQKPAMVVKMTELAMQTRTHAHTEIRPSTSATTSAGEEMAGRAGARVITSGRAKADTTTPGQGTLGSGEELKTKVFAITERVSTRASRLKL